MSLSNSPTEDLELPLWGREEWLFYSFLGPGGGILLTWPCYLAPLVLGSFSVKWKY